MKQLIALFMLLLAVSVSLPASVLAAEHENETVDLDDEDATEAIAEAEVEIALAAEVIAEGEADGVDVTDAQALLDQANELLTQAQTAFAADDFVGAEALAEDAKELAEDAADLAEDAADEAAEEAEDESDEHETENESESDENEIEDESDENETENEHEVEDIVSSSTGAQMRMLQLHHQIELKITQANIVISRLENSTVNATASQVESLKNITASLVALSVEVEAAAETAAADEATVEAFLAFKAEAKDLVQQFRDTLKGILGEGDRSELRQRFEEAKDEHRELRLEIREKQRELNAERIRGMLTALGVDLEELAAKIEAGEINVSQVRARLHAHLQSLDTERKRDAAERLTEAETRLRIARADAIAQARLDMNERRMELRERLEDNREEHREEADRLRIEWRERVENHTVDVRERIEIDGDRLRVRSETRVREDSSGSSDDSSDDNSVESETRLEAEVTI